MRLGDSAKRFIREPLVHFLLLGAALFAVFGWRSGGFGGDAKRIVVTQGRMQSLASTFATTYMRAPSAQETDGLIRDYIREEVAVREATALGLDQDDQIVRRRLRQKLEFVAQGFTAPPEPTDSVLQAYLAAHPAEFATERKYTFRQVYLDPSRHGADLPRDAERIRAALRRAGAKADLGKVGDASPIRSDLASVSSSEVRFDLGENFAVARAELPVGEWQGPVRSSYGVHIVLVTARTEGGVPILANVRDAVRREWMSDQQKAAAASFYAALLQRYAVTIEAPRPTAGSADSAGAGR